MIDPEVGKWLVMAGLSGFVWFMKRTLNSVEESLQKLKSETDYIKDKYLHKDDFREFKTELRGMFEEIRKDIKELRRHE